MATKTAATTSLVSPPKHSSYSNNNVFLQAEIQTHKYNAHTHTHIHKTLTFICLDSLRAAQSIPRTTSPRTVLGETIKALLIGYDVYDDNGNNDNIK